VGGGNNLVSRLAELVADEGLGDSFTTFNTPYQNTGLFGIYGTTEQGKCEDFVHALVTEFVRLARGVSEKEVERARNKLKSTILMQLDGTPAICEDIGRQVLVLTRRMPPAEIFMRIDMVTADEVKRVAEEYLYDNEVAYAAMGPVADFPDYNFIRGWTYSNLL
jgi:processing peptidase subunit beta